MEFEEWFDTAYPKEEWSPSLQLVRLTLKEVAEKAWIIARQELAKEMAKQ